jgi:hypothetical protein
MEIEIKWHTTIDLVGGSKNNLIYSVPNLENYYNIPGVYMFCRNYAKSIIPLYIGKSENIGKRVEQHLDTTTKMKAIEREPNGKRILIIGEVVPKKGQQISNCIKIVEKALIDHALANGYELINDKGTKSPYHTLSFFGNQLAKNFTRNNIFVKEEN